MTARPDGPKAVLVDLTRCIGCRGCQVACKAWNENDGEKTTAAAGFTNPPTIDANTFTMVACPFGSIGYEWERLAPRVRKCSFCAGNGKYVDHVYGSSARGDVTVKAVVTGRMQSLTIDGKDVPIVWMPYNWGFKGLSRGASTNLVTIDAGDPNTWIQETKACLVDVQRIGVA